ncbi:MAG: DUF5317 domain-containing protein [Caldilineaceae bacterium]
MILLLAVLVGILAGMARAWYGKRPFLLLDIQAFWLVLVAFVPQWLAFYLPLTRQSVTDEVASIALISSQSLLFIFAWLNRKQSAFWVLGIGLILNLLVIVLNGGLMPVSPATLAQISPSSSTLHWSVGRRVGISKDILLPPAKTRLAWLSDRFLLPAWFPYQGAFSLGDIFIAGGAFWLLWSAGRSRKAR